MTIKEYLDKIIKENIEYILDRSEVKNITSTGRLCISIVVPDSNSNVIYDKLDGVFLSDDKFLVFGRVFKKFDYVKEIQIRVSCFYPDGANISNLNLITFIYEKKITEYICDLLLKQGVSK